MAWLGMGAFIAHGEGFQVLKKKKERGEGEGGWGGGADGTGVQSGVRLSMICTYILLKKNPILRTRCIYILRI